PARLEQSVIASEACASPTKSYALPRGRPSAAPIPAIVNGRWNLRRGERREPIVQGECVLQQRTLTIAALVGFGLIAAGPAFAQGIYIGPRMYGPGPQVYDGALPPHEIMRIVRSTGLAPLTRPARRGPYYVILAGNRSGGQMRVMIDAYGGGVVRI